MHDDTCRDTQENEFVEIADLLRGHVKKLLLADYLNGAEVITAIEAAKQLYWFDVWARTYGEALERQRNNWHCEH
mgnify:CR=1 FL=1